MPSFQAKMASLAALLLNALLVPSALYRGPARVGDRTLLLAVELNGRALDVMVEAQEHDGAIGVQPGDLPAIGLHAPPGSAATVLRTGRRVPVGHGGEVFLDDLDPVERLQVNGPAGRCQATIHFTAVPGDIPEIGPIVCERTPA